MPLVRGFTLVGPGIGRIGASGILSAWLVGGLGREHGAHEVAPAVHVVPEALPAVAAGPARRAGHGEMAAAGSAP